MDTKNCEVLSLQIIVITDKFDGPNDSYFWTKKLKHKNKIKIAMKKHVYVCMYVCIYNYIEGFQDRMFDYRIIW